MTQNFKVGDLLTDFVCIYEITSLTPGANNISLIHYRPIKGTDKVFTDVIPENNLIKSGLRPLLTSKEIKSFLTELKTKVLPENYIFDPRQLKEDIYSNTPEKLIDYLKYFYQKGDTLIKVERDFKEDIVSHLCLEISFVTDKPISSVKKTIESAILDK
jgi:hypothetical protein